MGAEVLSTPTPYCLSVSGLRQLVRFERIEIRPASQTISLATTADEVAVRTLDRLGLLVRLTLAVRLDKVMEMVWLAGRISMRSKRTSWRSPETDKQ